jgi:hypothetical protein
MSIELKNSPEEVYAFFKFLVENKTKHRTSELMAEAFIVNSQIEKELSTKKQHFIDVIKDFSFYTEENYSFDVDDRSTLHLLMRFLNETKNEIIRLLYKEKKQTSGILKRLVSPPVGAYDYSGHNKLDIKPSGKGHGLLFE